MAVLLVVVSTVSCNPDDESTNAPLRDYQTQYNDDLALIEQFMKTHSYSVVNNPGAFDDQDVTYTEVPLDDPSAMWNSPDKHVRTYTRNGVEYSIYYISIREGGGADQSALLSQPTNVDAVLSSYEGRYLIKQPSLDENQNPILDENGDPVMIYKNNVFETNPYPETFLGLESTIFGWREIFPQFRPGNHSSTNGQPNIYTDFGSGIMFIPSALAYYNNAKGSIPAYAPLIFAFKLYDINRLDQDGDGIPSYREDINGDRYFYFDEDGAAIGDDSDLDEVPDYLDLDDDNDGLLTRTEITDADGNLYSFDLIPMCGDKKIYLNADLSCNNQ